MAVDITFLGTGTAEDASRTNTAYLITHHGTSIQVDAGYDVYGALCESIGCWKTLAYRPDLTMFTHGHGDHMGSFSRQLLSMWRACDIADSRRDYMITGEPDALSSIRPRMEADYPGYMEKLVKGRINLRPVPINDMKSFRGFQIDYAPTHHSIRNYSYRFDVVGSSFAISGDGNLTPESRRLFEGVGLLVHEGFTAEDKSDNHACVRDVYEYAKSAGINRVAIVHVDPIERAGGRIRRYEKTAKDNGIFLWFPNDGESTVA